MRTSFSILIHCCDFLDRVRITIILFYWIFTMKISSAEGCWTTCRCHNSSFRHSINQVLNFFLNIINKIWMCMAVEHCKHAKPMIYMSKAAVPEARKTFLATGQITKTLKFLRGRVKIGWHVVRTFEIDWPAWLSGWSFHSRGLIQKTISWQTSGPLPWDMRSEILVLTREFEKRADLCLPPGGTKPESKGMFQTEFLWCGS